MMKLDAFAATSVSLGKNQNREETVYLLSATALLPPKLFVKGLGEDDKWCSKCCGTLILFHF